MNNGYYILQKYKRGERLTEAEERALCAWECEQQDLCKEEKT